MRPTGTGRPPASLVSMPAVGDHWAWEKHTRAIEHVTDLDQRMRHWQQTAEPHFTSAIADDRLAWSVVARIAPWPPPVGHWALIVGDAIHNLRSALDVLTWDHATIDGLTLRQKQQIGFPICDTQAKWDQALGRLAPVDERILTRIRALQPFNRPEDERPGDMLTLLHALDIDDKHRVAIHASAALTDATFGSSIEFESNEAAARNVPPNTTVDTTEAEQGSFTVSGTTIDRIVKIQGGVKIGLAVTLTTPIGDVPLLEYLGKAIRYVAEVINYVE